jgi:N-acetylmuramoyl-L-alanine amidase
VGRLQLALRRAGISVDKADGIFGPSLQIAVEEFQQKNKLVVDGVVGKTTSKLLNLDPA